VSKVRPIIRSYLIVLTCGSLVRPYFSPGLSADESLDLRGSKAAGLWHTACHGAVKGIGPATPVRDDKVAVQVSHWQFAGRFRTNISVVSSASLSISHHLSL